MNLFYNKFNYLIIKEMNLFNNKIILDNTLNYLIIK